MTRDLRMRIVILQVLLILVFGFGSGLAFWASNFAHDQITSQLTPQQISFPADQKSGLPADLQAYAGQQVVNGDQARAYAEKFIALHLNTIGQGKPYSYWSGQAQQEKDPAAKAKLDATATTLFRGETLRSMLNQAWAFWFVGDIAMYAAIGLLVATLVVVLSLVYELVLAPKAASQTVTGGAPARSAI